MARIPGQGITGAGPSSSMPSALKCSKCGRASVRYCGVTLATFAMHLRMSRERQRCIVDPYFKKPKVIAVQHCHVMTLMKHFKNTLAQTATSPKISESSNFYD